MIPASATTDAKARPRSKRKSTTGLPYASAKGWAQMWLKENPQGWRSRSSPDEYKRAALHQGHIAVNSILRDWIKGQVTAIESGILSFEAVFMPFMLTSDGRPMIERARDLLPAPTEEKVVSLPGVNP
jgi:hypothetical protein